MGKSAFGLLKNTLLRDSTGCMNKMVKGRNVVMLEHKRRKQAKSFPYYTVQYWDEFSICWVAIHKKFPDAAQAENFVLTLGKKFRIGSKYRVMVVTSKGAEPYKTFG